MAWEWSHTQEAYDAALANLIDLPDATVATIWAEWRASDELGKRDSLEPEFNPHKYRRELRRAHSLLRRGFRETLENDVWDYANQQALCTNGGWEAWLCPYGCGCHMVPFNREGS